MYEERSSTSDLINCVWHAVAKESATFTDPANEYWGLAFTKHVNGSFSAELVGPTLKPRSMDSHSGEEYWGMEFKAHVVMRGVNKQIILGDFIKLPVSRGCFYVAKTDYDIPSYETLESMVDQLEKSGVIAGSDIIRKSLGGNEKNISQRSRQRHFKQVTGLTKKQITQLERARHAFFLLQSGSNATEVANEVGYSDQAHMIRSLKAIRSETPAQIIARYASRK